MPQKVIRFKGINRKINEFQTSGECEELINLRPGTDGGYHVVKPKAVEISDVSFDAYYEHIFGDVNNKITVHLGRVYWYSNQLITSEFYGSTVDVSFAGNVLMVYCEDEKRQLVFKFEDGKYKPYNISLKQITGAEVSCVYSTDTLTAYNSVTAEEASVGAYNEAMYSAASGFYHKYPNGLCGAAVVGCTYELEDGSELWSTAFVVANVTRCNGYIEPNIDTDSKQVIVSGASKAILNLTFANVEATGVRSINVYATKPEFPYEIEYTGEAYKVNDMSLEDINLAGQIMYYQGSISPDGTSARFILDFGKEQTGEQIMPVTPGCIERTGNAVSYNNRFHFYRSEVQHILQVPTISDIADRRTSSSHWIAYVKVNDTWKLIDHKYRFSESVPQDFIYPMAGIKQLAFVKASWESDGDFWVPYQDMFYVDLKDSSAYNYSFAFDVVPTIVSAAAFEVAMESVGQAWGDGFDKSAFLRNETNIINVSAPFNPYVFPVEYSYNFGGEILSVATSYLPISSTQVGQYPLTVFTTNGIYALEQGNGAVLYSNVVPLQPLVIDGSPTTTPYGTFFVSSKKLYLLSGRVAADLSYVLDGEREMTLRGLDSYKKLCCTSNSMLYNFSSLLSSIDFRDFISNAVLTYDQLQNEIIISYKDSSRPYSYVLNLDTKAYHKIAKRYLPSTGNARYVIEAASTGNNLVDLHSERDTTQPVLMQSRPFSLEQLYTHIQRLLLLADAQLTTVNGGAYDDFSTSVQNLCLSVFASDNLNDWECIISSQKYSVALRHMRTNRAAKSYKDYVVLISGVVDTDTDISDLIADYTVVNRRLG